MCDITCNTCSGSLFSECLSCSAPRVLLGSGCYCVKWDSSCLKYSSIQPAIQLLASLLPLLYAIVILCFFLRVRLRLSYRLLAWHQFFGLFLESRVLPLEYETQEILKLVFNANGPYRSNYRFEPFALAQILTPLCLLIVGVLLLTCGWTLHQNLNERLKTFKEHFFQSWAWYYLSFFFCSARIMWLLLGKQVTSASSSVFSISMSAVIGLVLFIGLLLTVIKYRSSTEMAIYRNSIFVYGMISPAVAFIIPLASSDTLLLVLALLPIGILLLLLIFNRSFPVFTKENAITYTVELLCTGFCVILVKTNEAVRVYALLGFLCLSTVAIMVEGLLVRHGIPSIQFGTPIRSSRVAALQADKTEEEDSMNKSQKLQLQIRSSEELPRDDNSSIQ